MTYEVLAIRYGHAENQRSSSYYRYEAYHEGDRAEQLDFYFWLVRGHGRIILVDTGYSPETLAKRGKEGLVIHPVTALRELGIEPEDVDTVILTHFHYDHIGNVSAYPNASFVAHRAEYEFWTGRHGKEPVAVLTADLGEIDEVVELRASGRLELLENDLPIAPGLRVHKVGGHTPGQLIVIVEDPDGGVVLASDSVHWYEELNRSMPFQIFFDLVEMYDAYALLRAYEDAGAEIVAGHDPLVMSRYPAVAGHEAIAVRIR